MTQSPTGWASPPPPGVAPWPPEYDSPLSRPSGDRPSGDRPSGDRPSGDRPSGESPLPSIFDRLRTPPQRVTGFMVTGWIAVAFLVGAVLAGVLNPHSDALGSVLLAVVLALGAVPGLFLLRPTRQKVIIAGAALLVAAGVCAFVSAFHYQTELLTTVAAAGWLLLRGRSTLRLLFALLTPILVTLIFQVVPEGYELVGDALGDVPPVAYDTLTTVALPVVVVAWLATIGLPTRPRDVTQTLGIVSLVLALLHLSVFAIVAGHLANRRLRTEPGPGGGLAFAGLAIGYVVLPVDLALLTLLINYGLI